MDTSTIVKHFCAEHNAGEYQFKAQLATLRKVAQRAVAAWEAAPIRGAEPQPFIQERLSGFCYAIKSGETPAQDVDLLPAAHPARAGNDDPWAALESAEDRLASLAKSAIGAVSRVNLRKNTVEEIGNTHRRMVHLYDLNFAGNAHEVSATGVVRADLVKATATVHEELERRGIEVSPQHALYEEALTLRKAPVTAMAKGEILQNNTAAILDLPGLGVLALPLRKVAADPALAANVFHPEGSKWHHAFREPAETGYEVELKPATGEHVGEFTFSPGAVTKSFTEVFVSGAISGVLVIGPETVTLRKALQPFVLTDAAVASGWMPPDGESALPASLELDIPPELRYWKAADGEDPKEIRDQLVKSGLLDAGSVALVNGNIRRVVTKTFVAESYPAEPSLFASAQVEVEPHDVLSRCAGVSVFKAEASGRYLADEDYCPDTTPATASMFIAKALRVSPERFVNRIEDLGLDWYTVSAPDSAEMRKELERLGRPFKMAGSDQVFVSSRHITSQAEYLDTSPQAPVTKNVTLLKSSNDEQRYVLGVVLEPETVDAQADIYSADEVRKSAHIFMAQFRNAGLQHQTLVNDKVRIVESYLAPVDMELNGQVVKSGTWILGVIVDDDKIWADVKSGKITGFSIGGSAIRTVDEDD